MKKQIDSCLDPSSKISQFNKPLAFIVALIQTNISDYMLNAVLQIMTTLIGILTPFLLKRFVDCLHNNQTEEDSFVNSLNPIQLILTIFVCKQITMIIQY